VNANHAPDIEVQALTVSYGSFIALERLSVKVPVRQIVGIVGPNGAGKTTLLNAVSGFSPVSSGRILFGGNEIQGRTTRQLVRAGIVRGFQTVRLMERESVLTNILVGTERLGQPTALAQLMGLPAQRRARRRDIAAAWGVIELLGLASDAHRAVNELPFAARRLVEVGRVLVARPEVILLDEPAAGLDRGGRTELASVLSLVHERHPSTMMIVEHDVDFVRNLCAHAIALDAGSLIHSGAPADVFAHPRVQLAYFGRQVDAPA
jgi:branched-chain amino acid transport system ATP-binding protein